jgi:hypothetical protein
MVQLPIVTTSAVTSHSHSLSVSTRRCLPCPWKMAIWACPLTGSGCSRLRFAPVPTYRVETSLAHPSRERQGRPSRTAGSAVPPCRTGSHCREGTRVPQAIRRAPSPPATPHHQLRRFAIPYHRHPRSACRANRLRTPHPSAGEGEHLRGRQVRGASRPSQLPGGRLHREKRLHWCGNRGEAGAEDEVAPVGICLPRRCRPWA